VVCCKLAPTSASHNYVISHIECLNLTVSQSTILRVYSLQFLCKSTHSGMYKRKCFFSDYSVSVFAERLAKQLLPPTNDLLFAVFCKSLCLNIPATNYCQMLAEIADEQGFSTTYDDIAELTDNGN